MKQRFIEAIGIAGMMLTWTWPVFVALSFATTCTMGADGSWTTTLVICTLITAVALPALLVSASSDTGARMRLSVPVMTVGPLALALVHAVDVGFGIHHLCGPEYDDYLTAG